MRAFGERCGDRCRTIHEETGHIRDMYWTSDVSLGLEVGEVEEGRDESVGASRSRDPFGDSAAQ